MYCFLQKFELFFEFRGKKEDQREFFSEIKKMVFRVKYATKHLLEKIV